MSPDEFARIRKSNDLSLSDLARLLRLSPMKGAQMLREFEYGKREVSGPISVIMDLLDQGYIDHLRDDARGGEQREISLGDRA